MNNWSLQNWLLLEEWAMDVDEIKRSFNEYFCAGRGVINEFPCAKQAVFFILITELFPRLFKDHTLEYMRACKEKKPDYPQNFDDFKQFMIDQWGSDWCVDYVQSLQTTIDKKIAIEDFSNFENIEIVETLPIPFSAPGFDISDANLRVSIQQGEQSYSVCICIFSKKAIFRKWTVESLFARTCAEDFAHIMPSLLQSLNCE